MAEARGCSRCGGLAVLLRRPGMHLCQRHFIEEFEGMVLCSLSRDVSDGDRIAVALSGGKDSSALLLAMQRLLSRRDVELVAVTVDEGIAGYRDDTMRAARDLTGALGVEWRVVSFREEYGLDLDGMVRPLGAAPCTICGVLRKRSLNRAARELGASWLATGHNLDDEAQSVMMNYLKGDIERLLRLRPARMQPGLVPRIKPLSSIPEREVALYCMANGILEGSRECPYAHLSLRADVRTMMNSLERLFPGTKQSTMSGFERIAEMARGRWSQMELGLCRKCGEPCVGALCKACELLRALDA